MVPPELEPRPLLGIESTATGLANKRISTDEIATHNKEKDCWVTIDNRVFDLSDYMCEHPGGKNPILSYGGGDVTQIFHSVHAHDANYIKERFCIGVATESADLHNIKLIPATERALNPRRWVQMELVAKEDISPDTRRFHFQIPDKSKKVGMPVGQHVLVGADIHEQFVMRPYSPTKPVTIGEDKGILELVVKIYFPSVHPMFPHGGLMSQYLDGLKIGDTVKIKGPTGHVLYHGKGNFTINGNSMKVKRISMVAGGTGITPMYQLISSIVQDPGDKTQISLIFSNKTEEDILLRKELDEFAKQYKNFKLWHTISRKAPEGWKYSVGRVNVHMFKEHLFPPSYDSVVFLCGPPAMVEHGCVENLERLGYTEDDMIEF